MIRDLIPAIQRKGMLFYSVPTHWNLGSQNRAKKKESQRMRRKKK